VKKVPLGIVKTNIREAMSIFSAPPDHPVMFARIERITRMMINTIPTKARVRMNLLIEVLLIEAL
jgi:hypothetical protein